MLEKIITAGCGCVNVCHEKGSSLAAKVCMVSISGITEVPYTLSTAGVAVAQGVYT